MHETWHDNQVREEMLKATNLLLLAREGTNIGPDFLNYESTQFLQQYLGIKRFGQPILSINTSDEGLEGFDSHLSFYRTNSPYLYASYQGEGFFGDHETAFRMMVFSSNLKESDLNIEKELNNFELQIEPFGNRSFLERELIIADIESGIPIVNKPIRIDREGFGDPKNLVRHMMTGTVLMDIASTGKYFVCIARLERVEKFLESGKNFSEFDLGPLIDR